MMLTTFITQAEAAKLLHTPLNDVDLNLLLGLANSKLASAGRKCRILLRPTHITYATGFWLWRKDRVVTRYELIVWYTFENTPSVFKSYNWPSIPGDEPGNYRPFGTPGQVKTYLEAFTNQFL